MNRELDGGLLTRLLRAFRRRSIAVAIVAAMALAGWAATAFARTVGTAPSPPPKRGGGPQTGTGTSDVVRSIVPPKSQG